MTEASVRRDIVARSNGICEGCGSRRATNIHHRRKARRQWVLSNVLHLCGTGTQGCHGHLESHPEESIVLGRWVPSWDDPATVPVWAALFGGSHWAWWLLGDDTSTPLPDLPAPVHSVYGTSRG